jgi:hypothetical protein
MDNKTEANAYLKKASVEEYSSSREEIAGKIDVEAVKLLQKHVEDYERRANQKHRLKEEFFRKVMKLLFSLVLIPFSIVLVAICTKLAWVSIAALLTGAAEILVALVKLPEIIAKYLFNPNEEQSNNSLIENILGHSKAMHDRADNNTDK